MRVIYFTCFADPWVKVALKLKEEHDYEPVYWVGYEDDDSENIIPKTFPDCIYQDYYDAWKGVFSKEIENHLADGFIDIDFLKNFASFELQAIKMMDRMDVTGYNFNFMERQRHFRRMVKYLSAVLKSLKIDLVICDIVPHRVSDYVLFLLCKYYNIRFVTFVHTHFDARFIPVNGINTIGDSISDDYLNIVKSSITAGDILKILDKEIIDRVGNIKKSYDIAEPDYMRQHALSHKKSAGFFSLFKKFITDMTGKYTHRYWGKKGFFKKGIPTYYKEKNKSIESSHVSLLKYSYLKLKNNKYKHHLKKHYETLVCEPDLHKPFVAFNMHYQPEMTSNPSGDIFVDQLLCIEILAKNLPGDYFIYVKEHRSQFYSHGEGHTGRIKEFYNDILKYQQVRLIPLNYDPFTLINHSCAIATVTGTSGWEGMVLGKPVIIFGITWYEKYDGVLKITDEKSAKEITNFIENFKFDERNLLSYLYAVDKNALKAYYLRDQKESANMPEEECVNVLIQTILKEVDKK